jgi:hypothetical protein
MNIRPSFQALADEYDRAADRLEAQARERAGRYGVDHIKEMLKDVDTMRVEARRLRKLEK